MSKSYNNTIPLFAPRDQLRKLINGITTDSRAPGEPKEVEGSALFQIYQAFASDEETAALRGQYAAGIAWGDAKQLLFERIDREIAPMRERYEHLITHPGELEQVLQAGAAKARELATPFIQQLRSVVGLRDLSLAPQARGAKTVKTALPQFKQYREADGLFYFKLIAADGQLLLQSQGFAAPKEAGQSIARLQSEGAAALEALADKLQAVPGLDQEQLLTALELLQETA